MPTYEYVCTQCGTHIEVVLRFGDDPPAQCGVCGGPLRKVFHPAGILFKGSGFYKTDSRKTSKTPEKTSEAAKADGKTSESSPAAAKSAPSGDAKPAKSAKEKTA